MPAPFRALLAVLLAALSMSSTAPCAHDLKDTATKMRGAAGTLAASLDARKRATLVHAFAEAGRTEWHYTPRSRPGLSFADMDPAQREHVHALLKTALSAVGHRKVVNIVELELVLKEMEFAMALLRDPEKYFIVFWGMPDATAPWGWRFEGHHLSLNFTVRGDSAIATTPSFFGANPAEVKKGPRRGTRVLAAEEDEARKLVALLDEEQRRTVIVDARTYGDIVTAAQELVSPLDNRGLEVRAMNAAQRAQLRKLIEVYADGFEPVLRAARIARVEEGFEGARFAWAGATERGKQHYYRVQGPKFLIEYDASQNDGNHVHTVWRDFDGDFGRDLLRDHHVSMLGTSHRH